jgi:CDP-paratose 2-epimerase
MKYLITGGCGFIGCNFALKLLGRGDGVVLLDNLSRKGAVQNLAHVQSLYPAVDFLHVDVRIDSLPLRQIVEQVDCIFHLAGQVAVTQSIVEPRDDFAVNALGTLNVLEAVRLSRRRPSLIYASTNKVYGELLEIPVSENGSRYEHRTLPNGIPETQPLYLQSPYGCSKGAADQYVRDYAEVYGLRTVVMRQSCIYGRRQFGVEDQGWLAWFTIAAVTGRPIVIYGNGKQVRDALFVDDLFEAWDLAARHIDENSGKVFNVGGGPRNTVSLLESVAHLENAVGRKIEVQFGDWRTGDQKVYVSDVARIRSDLHWEPATNVNQGLDILYRWVSENRKTFD